MYRVLNIIDSLGAGGIEMWLLRMAEAMPRNECSMDFFCKGRSIGIYAEKARELGANVFHCPLQVDHLRYVRGLTRVLQREQYDIVHNHLDYAAAPGVWTSRRLGIPVVSTIHNTAFPPLTWTRLPIAKQLREIYGRRSLSYALRSSRIVTGVSRGVLDSVVPNHENQERCRVLYLGVESTGRCSQDQRSQFRGQLQMPEDSQIVLHVGRFTTAKNHVGLLRIFKRVQATVPNARLLLVGDGPERNTIEQKIEHDGMGHIARCLGTRDDVARIMGCADVFLLPSFHEGFPVVALEAAGAGLPVVGSDIAGLNEAVIHRRTGLLHQVDDEAAMATSVIELLSDAQHADSFRRAAADRIRGELSTEAVVERLLKIYQDVSPKSQSHLVERCAA